jgi:hypothetical protein
VGTSAVSNDIVAQTAVDTSGLHHPVIEELDPLFGGFVMRHSAQQLISLHDDFQCIAEIVRQTADLFGLFYRDGGRIGRHSDLSREQIALGFMLVFTLAVPGACWLHQNASLCRSALW